MFEKDLAAVDVVTFPLSTWLIKITDWEYLVKKDADITTAIAKHPQSR